MKKVVLLTGCIFILLLIASVYSENIKVAGLEILKPDIVSDLYFNPGNDTVQNNTDINYKDYILDSTDLTINYITDFRKDGMPALANYFKTLRKAEIDSSSVRIAFLGDSMIEGDLVTQTLRFRLQQKFGGKGVGFMPITSQSSGFRKTIRHEFTSGWNVSSVINNPQNPFIGISGFVYNPSGSPGVTYKPSDDSFDNLKEFYTLKLYYGRSKIGDYVTLSGDNYYLTGKGLYNQVVLNDSTALKEANIRFHCSGSNIYGLSFEYPRGVILDNYSVRGNSGIPLNFLTDSMIKNTDSIMNYSLIILQYGLNIANPDTKDLKFYTDVMVPAVNKLKKHFINADILIMSVSDKCWKRAGKYTTEPSISVILEAQKYIASETGCAFWNLFDNMGGRNSMVKWVEKNLANKDYTHFNYEGAEIVGNYLFNQLMFNYLNYLKLTK